MKTAYVGWLHAVKGAPLSLVVALLLQPGRQGARALSLATGWSDTQVTFALQKLSALGYIENKARYNGWQLSPALRHLLLELLPEWLAGGETNAQLVREWDIQADERLDLTPGAPCEAGPAPEIEITPGGSPFGRPGSEIDESPPVMRPVAPAAHGCALGQDWSASRWDWETTWTTVSGAGPSPIFLDSPKLDHPPLVVNLTEITELRESDSLSDSLTNSPGAAGNEPTPERELSEPSEPGPIEVSRLLTATGWLFGERVFGSPRTYSEPQRLLGWIAAAYDQRHSLRKPARVVYANYKAGWEPSPEYLHTPLDYLPEEFLQQAGLWVDPGPPAETSLPGGECSTPLDSAREPPAGLLIPLSPHTALTAAQAWDQAVQSLEFELSISAYRYWLLPARLAGYDPPRRCFTFAVPDEQLRLIWQQRLQRQLERCLAGICAGEVAVQVITEQEAAVSRPYN